MAGGAQCPGTVNLIREAWFRLALCASPHPSLSQRLVGNTWCVDFHWEHPSACAPRKALLIVSIGVFSSVEKLHFLAWLQKAELGGVPGFVGSCAGPPPRESHHQSRLAIPQPCVAIVAVACSPHQLRGLLCASRLDVATASWRVTDGRGLRVSYVTICSQEFGGPVFPISEAAGRALGLCVRSPTKTRKTPHNGSPLFTMAMAFASGHLVDGVCEGCQRSASGADGACQSRLCCRCCAFEDHSSSLGPHGLVRLAETCAWVGHLWLLRRKFRYVTYPLLTISTSVLRVGIVVDGLAISSASPLKCNDNLFCSTLGREGFWHCCDSTIADCFVPTACLDYSAWMAGLCEATGFNTDRTACW